MHECHCLCGERSQRKEREELLILIEDAILDTDRQRELQLRCDAVALPSMRPDKVLEH
jgi:hypothetical protein